MPSKTEKIVFYNYEHKKKKMHCKANFLYIGKYVLFFLILNDF